MFYPALLEVVSPTLTFLCRESVPFYSKNLHDAIIIGCTISDSSA